MHGPAAYALDMISMYGAHNTSHQLPDFPMSDADRSDSSAGESLSLSGIHEFLYNEGESRHPIWPVPTYLLDWSHDVKLGIDTDTTGADTVPDPTGDTDRLRPIERLRRQEADRPADEIKERRQFLIGTVWKTFASRLESDGAAALHATRERLEERRRKLGVKEDMLSRISYLSDLQGMLGNLQQAPAGPLLDLSREQKPARSLVEWIPEGFQLIARPHPSEEEEPLSGKHVVFFDRSSSIADIHAALEGKIGRISEKIDANEALRDWIQFQRAVLKRMLWLYDLGGDLSSIPASIDVIPSGVPENPTAVHQARAIIEALEAHEDHTLDEPPQQRTAVEALIDDRLPDKSGQTYAKGASRLFKEVLDQRHEGFDDTLTYLRRYRADITQWSKEIGGYDRVVGDPARLKDGASE